MTNKIIMTVLVIIALVGGFFLLKNMKAPPQVLFPSGGETLVAGKTYTIQWNNKGKTGAPAGPTTQIFLIDEALLSQGASVSITDRVYDVPDTGSYEYTIPSAVSDSNYFFVIGTTTSKTFKITSASE